MMHPEISHIESPNLTGCGTDVVKFLRHIARPSTLLIKGKNPDRTRVVCTLLHGNEPSGSHAIFQYLKSQRTPFTNALFFFGSIEAALSTPVFTHRHLPSLRDLNRCFKPPYDDKQGKLAKAFIDLLIDIQPESVVDIHNTSGDNPPFAVSFKNTDQHKQMSQLFCEHMVFTQIELGALMELELGFPIVTIECGGNTSPNSHKVAYDGLVQYLETPDIFCHTDKGNINVLTNPWRLEIASGQSLHFLTEPSHHTITLIPDIERYNFSVIGPADPLGWINHDLSASLIAKDAHGNNCVEKFFRCQHGKIFPKTDLQLFMITTNPVIAKSDCLCYFVERPKA